MTACSSVGTCDPVEIISAARCQGCWGACSPTGEHPCSDLRWHRSLSDASCTPVPHALQLADVCRREIDSFPSRLLAEGPLAACSSAAFSAWPVSSSVPIFLNLCRFAFWLRGLVASLCLRRWGRVCAAGESRSARSTKRLPCGSLRRDWTSHQFRCRAAWPRRWDVLHGAADYLLCH